MLYCCINVWWLVCAKMGSGYDITAAFLQELSRVDALKHNSSKPWHLFSSARLSCAHDSNSTICCHPEVMIGEKTVHVFGPKTLFIFMLKINYADHSDCEKVHPCALFLMRCVSFSIQTRTGRIYIDRWSRSLLYGFLASSWAFDHL